MPTFAYLRVSTIEQTTEQQLREITNAGHVIESDRVYVEHGVSGKVPALQRQQFAHLRGRLKAGDTLVVSKLDRLGRDLLDVIATVKELAAAGIALEVLGLGKLDRSAQSQLTLNMLAAISEFERQIISERTKAKLAQKKADGAKLGRPTKTDDAALRTKAAGLFAEGMSWRKVAAELGIALSTLQRLMRAPRP
ncbi:MAG: recombinase family protein [Zoogloeaceae bacterium]|nr:recombinase family protein [Zoogloeaceae bacterium]MCW5616589.1 recombinase family protein [Rhodocyclaceae bacterium]